MNDIKNSQKRQLTTTILFVFFTAFCLHSRAQTSFPGLLSAGSAVWKDHFYLFGIDNRTKVPRGMIFRLNHELQVTDSLDAGSFEPGAQFLRCWSDTTHGYLNIYFQQKGEDLVDVVRIDGKHKQKSVIRKIQTARLGNTGMLGARPYFASSRAYKVHFRSDTGGKQFYLNCYELKDPGENFDYLLKWQYAFERRFISDAFVIHADKRIVTLFVSVNDGPKKGKWLLSVNAHSGELIKGTRACPKEASDLVSYCAAHMDQRTRALHLVLGKTTPNNPAMNLLYSTIDSLGNMGREKEFALAWTEPKRGPAKTAPEMMLRVDRTTATETKLELHADLYIKDAKRSCFNYCNTIQLEISFSGEVPSMARYQLRSNRTVEDWLYLNDPQLLNGRICPDSAAGGRPFLHGEIAFPVKAGYRSAGKTAHFLLQKTETSKAQLSFARYGPEQGKMKLVPLAGVRKSLFPQLHRLSDSTFVIRQDADGTGVLLKKGAW